MTAHEILQLGHPLLWQRSAPVDVVESPKTRALIEALEATLADFRARHGVGRGIAAPQIGVLQRVLFVRMQPTGFCGPLINPEIVWRSDTQMVLWDDCFSFPQLLVQVRRAAEVRVAYTDAQGQRQMVDAAGDLSELLQHEIDHLDGILAVQRALSPTAFCTRAELERRYRDV